MKEIVKDSLKKLAADRYLLSLVISMFVLAIICAIIIGFNVHPRDLRLPSHYSAYGITHFYFDQWFYLLVFILFGIVTACLHAAIAVKLLIVKGHSLATMYAWAGIGIILLGLRIAMAVLNVQKIL